MKLLAALLLVLLLASCSSSKPSSVPKADAARFASLSAAGRWGTEHADLLAEFPTDLAAARSAVDSADVSLLAGGCSPLAALVEKAKAIESAPGPIDAAWSASLVDYGNAADACLRAKDSVDPPSALVDADLALRTGAVESRKIAAAL